LREKKVDKASLPSIPLEAELDADDVIKELIRLAKESDKSAEEILIHLLAKGKGIEKIIQEEIAWQSIEKQRLDPILQHARAIREAEEKALTELELVTGQEATAGMKLTIVDAQALINMREEELSEVFEILTADENNLVAVVAFDKEAEGVLRLIDEGKVTVVRADEIGEKPAEQAVLAKISRAEKPVNIQNVSVLASLENIANGNWRKAVAGFHYVVLNHNSLTVTALLAVYAELPQDVKQHLAEAGINREVIKRSEIREEKFVPARYELSAIVEIERAA